MAELGDPEAAKDLRFLQDDPRAVELDDDDDETTATLGDLVCETLAELEGDDGR